MRSSACLLALMLLAVAPARAGIREIVGPMTISMPDGWRREARPDGTVAFLWTADGRGEVQFTSVNAPAADQTAVHGALWAETKRQLQSPSRESSGRLGRFDWSEIEAFEPTENRRFWFRLYTTREGAAYVCTLVVAEVESAFRREVAVIDGVLSKAQFGGAAQAPLPQIAGDVPIVESQIHVEIRGVSLTSNVLTDHVLFFGNGVVVRTGVIDGPRECYAALPVANLVTLPNNYGRWREGGGAIDIAWQEGPPWRLLREGDRWTLDRKKLLKLRPIEGAKFDGVYVYRPVGDAPSALKLGADGRFEALNLTESMRCPESSSSLSQGAGVYEVRKWTLILRFDGGQGVVLLPLKIPDEERDLERVGKFTIKSYDFVKM